MNEYEEAANKFLVDTNTTLTLKLDKHDYYFTDDEYTRDIYNVTLKNDKHTYKFTFGQSIACQGKEPTPYSILASLNLLYCTDYEDFLSEYGYGSNKNSKKIYNMCVKQDKALRALFTEEELELLSEIN